MKTTLLLLISTFIALSFLSSCGKEEKDGPKPSVPEKLDGDWIMYEVRQDVIRDQQVFPVSYGNDFPEPIYITFTPPSDFTNRRGNTISHATYEVTSDSLILTSLSISSPNLDSIYTTTYYKIEKLADKELILSYVLNQTNIDKTVITSKYKRY